MDGFDKLDLSTETLRELTRDELSNVAGGTVGPISQTCFVIVPPTIIVTAVAGYVEQQLSVNCG